ncbi:MAG: dTDP-glucose 4,6-dehydratase [Gemmatimonadota bacterium]|nr:dTDP-glucose 4,6-dehydratase [Gemmatimonadota bacterium]
MRLLVTGGAGFIGSNLIRLLVETTDHEIVNLDALTYAGNLENLEGVSDSPRYRFIHGDICDVDLVDEALSGVDAVLHLAAESHVDRSIRSAAPFVRTNVLGTQTLLAAALDHRVGRFLHVSTDEVYGELPWSDPRRPDPSRSRFTEDWPLAPRSPYAASKAGSDALALAYHHTHGLDVVVTRCSNNYGPHQFPEKLIPLMVTNALDGLPLPVYGDGLYVRDWIHVEDHCRGLLAALELGREGEVYNFGGDAERTNLQVVESVLELLGRGSDLIRHVEDRAGHDRRYAIDATKAARELGWAPTVSFEEGLSATVGWYRNHEEWWRRVKAGAHRADSASVPAAGGRA